MWLSRREFLLGAAAAALAGCGFAPAYGTGGAASRLQNAILVQEPENHFGYLVTRRIEERLGKGGEDAPYRLALRIKFSQESLGSTSDGQLTRYHIIGNTTYALQRAADQSEIDSGTVHNFTAYSASGSTVSTLAAQRDAQDRLMIALADQVIERLVLAAPDL
ncbi:MAG: hypothetical protein EP318_15750 [Rhodobacteraceae bacterium]|nr:MAG: hypothetical protein EP318_15750 [Paracoccaceae bacterium]